jgi:hypothetical protein
MRVLETNAFSHLCWRHFAVLVHVAPASCSLAATKSLTVMKWPALELLGSQRTVAFSARAQSRRNRWLDGGRCRAGEAAGELLAGVRLACTHGRPEAPFSVFSNESLIILKLSTSPQSWD